MPFDTTPGSLLYCREHAQAGGVSAEGKPLPEWPDLPEAIQYEYEQAAQKIAAEAPKPAKLASAPKKTRAKRKGASNR